MRTNFIKSIMIMCGLIGLACLACGCSTTVATPPPPPPTYTPYPTYTPNLPYSPPTYTPYPTYTLYPINTPRPPPIVAPTTSIGASLSAPTTDPTFSAISNQQQLMDYLISHTTHFQGDPNATVTIIEFSDYQ